MLSFYCKYCTWTSRWEMIVPQNSNSLAETTLRVHGSERSLKDVLQREVGAKGKEEEEGQEKS